MNSSHLDGFWGWRRLKNQTVLFDLDDTLVHCNKYFDIVIEQFADQMHTWFGSYNISKRQITEKQAELDLIGVERDGFVAARFPQSFVETYEHVSALTGRRESEAEKDWLLKLGFSVYDSEFEPYPHVEETLTGLALQGHTLCLYTGGDSEIQRRKVRRAKLTRYFDDRIFVTVHKTTEAMEKLLNESNFDRDNTWMIGNSVTTDVLPALSAGIHTIYIPAEQEWSYNRGDVNIAPKGAYFKLSSLREVPGAISRYLTGRTVPHPVMGANAPSYD